MNGSVDWLVLSRGAACFITLEGQGWGGQRNRSQWGRQRRDSGAPPFSRREQTRNTERTLTCCNVRQGHLCNVCKREHIHCTIHRVKHVCISTYTDTLKCQHLSWLSTFVCKHIDEEGKLSLSFSCTQVYTHFPTGVVQGSERLPVITTAIDQTDQRKLEVDWPGCFTEDWGCFSDFLTLPPIFPPFFLVLCSHFYNPSSLPFFLPSSLSIQNYGISSSLCYTPTLVFFPGSFFVLCPWEATVLSLWGRCISFYCPHT